MGHFPLRAACRLGISVFIAALMVRTWLAMGLLPLVTVAGSSMAPTLLGPHRVFRCEVCGDQFPVGLDQLPPDDYAECPYCCQRSAGAIADQGGEHLLINRTAFIYRTPLRWDVVVFRSPEMADQLCVKRVVGLPGETVSLVDGDVWINGRPARKTLAQQQAVRQLVHRQRGDVALPPNADADANLPALTRWQWDATPSADTVRWLVYHHPGGGPITDDLSYNQRASYELHAMRDVMLTFQARLKGDGQLHVKATDGGGQWLVTWDASQGSVQLCRGTDEKGSALSFSDISQRDLSLAKNSSDPFSGRWAEWTFSLFDRLVLLAIDGRVVMVIDDTVGRPTDDPPEVSFAIGANGLRGDIRDLAVWRDVYYGSEEGSELFFMSDEPSWESRPKNSSDAFSDGWRLGPRQYFVLGDNAAVSDDSRAWLAGPGLDAKLMIGKPLGVR